MKIRKGFVSNSSSSSFVVVITKENHQKAIDKMEDDAKRFILNVIDCLEPTQANVFGKELVVIQGVDGNTSDFEDYSRNHYDSFSEVDKKAWDDNEFYASEIFDMYYAIVQKMAENGEDVIATSCSV